MPLYSHDGVVRWEDAKIKSDIPEPIRVYVLLPGNEPGIGGGPNGTPVLLPSADCRIVRFTLGLTVADVLRRVPTDAKKVLGINVYRTSAQPDRDPVFTAKRGDLAVAHFAIQPGDIIHLFYMDPNVPLRPNN